MQRSAQQNIHRIASLAAAVGCSVYFCALFPRAYFRHDDWGTVRNATDRVATNLTEIFSYFYDWGPNHEVWFFRPLFKLLGYLYYETFGLNYFGWLSANLAFTAIGLVFWKKTVDRLSGNPNRGHLFIALLACAFPLHLGSLLWAGEGVMNCPQVAFIAMSTFFFVRSDTRKDLTISLLALAASFCLKEASVFHVLFLGALVFTEPYFAKHRSWGGCLRKLGPFALLSAVYFVARLGLVPFNPGYLPVFELKYFVNPALIIFGALGIPWVATTLGVFLGLRQSAFPPELTRWIWFVPFFAACLAPYFGHPFFSPGWLLLPSVYATACLVLWIKDRALTVQTVALATGICLLLGAGTSLVRLAQMNWWQWKDAQQTLVNSLKDSPASATKLKLYSCEPAHTAYPFSRVVASPEALFDAWRVVRKTQPNIEILPCESAATATDAVHLKWNGTKLTWLNP